MDITFSNKNSIKLAGKNASIVINPDKETKADLYLFSNPEAFQGDFKAFYGPGEYEVLGSMVDGIEITPENTCYSVVIDDMHVTYAIDMESTFSDGQLDRMGGVDILAISVKDDKSDLMNKIITQVEPRILIPIMENEGELTKIKAEFGKDVEPTDKFKIVKKDLPTDSQQLVILK
jgi:hypothetical protein